MTQPFETRAFSELVEEDSPINRKKINFLSESDEENETSITNNSNKDDIKEKEEINENFNKLISSKKNFILKSDIYSSYKSSNNKLYSKNGNYKDNAIINYYFNPYFVKQNNSEKDYSDLNNKNVKDSTNISKETNINYNIGNNNSKNNKIAQYNYNNYNFTYLSQKNKENLNLNNSCHNYYQNMNNNQIKPPITNNIFNIIRTNNYFYSNGNNINIPSISPKSSHFNSQTMIIKDKLGSIVMKNKIISDPNFANEILFPQIKNDLVDLCCDNFGNYFLQTFFDVINFDNLSTFLDLISEDFTGICLSPQGTRVIQKLIEKIAFIPMLINKFIYILNRKELGIICKSQYGNHVIQKFLVTFYTFEYTFFLYNFIFQNFLDITNSKHGVFILQKCLSEGNKIHRETIYKLILENMLPIIQNEYGNYLIQFILLNNKEVEKTFPEILPIIMKIEENIVNLCISKHSANVIEKCFENSDNMIRNHILYSLLYNNSDKILDIFFNKYGIYVILKALKTQNGKYKDKIIELLNKKKNEFKYFFNSNDKNSKKILKIIQNNKELDDVYKSLGKKQ